MRGFTIIESLLTLVVLLILLGAVATVVQTYANVDRYASTSDRTLEGIQVALDMAGQELKDAISFTSPTAGAPSPILAFSRIDPNVTTRLPTSYPNPAPATWNPQDPAYLAAVSYYVDAQGNLIRSYLAPGAVPNILHQAGAGFAGFSCRLVGTNSIELDASFAQGGVTVSINKQYWRRL